MIRQLPESLTKRLQTVKDASRSQWVTVAVSFMAAVTLWFLVTLNSRNYQAIMPYPVKVANAPADILLNEELVPKEVIVTTKGSGIKLLSEYINLSRDTIFIDFRKFSSNKSFNYRGNISVIQEAMPLGVTAIKIEPEVIPLEYEIRISKMVPVVNALNAKLPETYRMASPPVFEPDSVKVLGPANLLDRVKSWKTQDLEIMISPKGTILNIPLDTMDLFKVDPPTVLVTFDPIPYTEAELQVPITAINVPKGEKLQFTPPTVTLKVSVPFDLFAELDKKDIRLTVDYNRLTNKSTFAVPQVSRLPEKAIVQGTFPEKVSFLIIREK